MLKIMNTAGDASVTLKDEGGVGSPTIDIDVRTLFQNVQVAGDTMTGALEVPAGASGVEVPQMQEVESLITSEIATIPDAVLKVGDTMIGNLEAPSITIGGDNLSPHSFKNILINGDMRVNQRGFNGNWGTLGNFNYGYDRWSIQDGLIYQRVEEGNYKPNTTYTLSGNNVTTAQRNSPASGNWLIGLIPNTATNIQLEEGNVATSFEKRPIALEVELCQRYYQKITKGPVLQGRHADDLYSRGNFTFITEMRATPSRTFTTDQGNSTWTEIAMSSQKNSGSVYAKCTSGASSTYANIDFFDIELESEL